MTFTSKQVEDLDTLKAVSHPIRIRLLGALRVHGPATASALGRELGESSGSTSYHLRQLERFGFVGDAVEQPSGRERRWKALHDLTSFPSALGDLEGGREYLDAVRRRQEEHLRDGLDAWREPRRGIGHADYMVRLAPDQLEQMTAEIEQVIERYAQIDSGEPVMLHVLALPAKSA
jgi:DNA-binding transcriptional ArsR family regulator